MRKLIYVDSNKPVQIGDQHRMGSWIVKVISMQDVENESFDRGSVRIAHCQGAAYEHNTYASNIGAEWVPAEAAAINR